MHCFCASVIFWSEHSHREELSNDEVLGKQVEIYSLQLLPSE